MYVSSLRFLSSVLIATLFHILFCQAWLHYCLLVNKDKKKQKQKPARYGRQHQRQWPTCCVAFVPSSALSLFSLFHSRIYSPPCLCSFCVLFPPYSRFFPLVSFLFRRVSTPVSQRHLQAWHAHCSVLLCMVLRWQRRSLIKRRVSENPFQNNKKQIVFISSGRGLQVLCQRAPG